MPKPCSKPLRQNPFESYRDPVTGQWKVRYPASALPVTSCSVQQVAQSALGASADTSSVHRLWKEPARKAKVA